MFIITGATGQLGHAIVKKVLERVPANQVGATCRDPKKADDLAALGVRVRTGDFDDVAALQHGFEGATQVLIVSSNARAQGGDPLIQHQNAIDAAVAVGAQRIVYTSQMAASARSAFPPMHDHAATEKMLNQCAVDWTALRHGFYASSAIDVLKKVISTGVLETAKDGPVAWTGHDDLAEAAAIVLTQKRAAWQTGPTRPLTGPQALDFGDLVGIASDVLHQPIRHVVLTDAEMQLNLIARGLPATVVKIILGRDIAARNGEFAPTDPTLSHIIRRPPTGMRDLMAAALLG